MQDSSERSITGPKSSWMDGGVFDDKRPSSIRGHSIRLKPELRLKLKAEIKQAKFHASRPTPTHIQFINGVRVITRGWTDSLIRLFALKPYKIAPNPRLRRAVPMQLYDLARIERLERDSRFQAKLLTPRGEADCQAPNSD
jgi:hypothetical protein